MPFFHVQKIRFVGVLRTRESIVRSEHFIHGLLVEEVILQALALPSCDGFERSFNIPAWKIKRMHRTQAGHAYFEKLAVWITAEVCVHEAAVTEGLARSHAYGIVGVDQELRFGDFPERLVDHGRGGEREEGRRRQPREARTSAKPLFHIGREHNNKQRRH